MNFEFDYSNHSNDSQQSNSSTDGKWVILEENLNRKEIEEFFRTEIPESTAYQTNNSIYCTIQIMKGPMY